MLCILYLLLVLKLCAAYTGTGVDCDRVPTPFDSLCSVGVTVSKGFCHLGGNSNCDAFSVSDIIAIIPGGSKIGKVFRKYPKKAQDALEGVDYLGRRLCNKNGVFGETTSCKFFTDVSSIVKTSGNENTTVVKKDETAKLDVTNELTTITQDVTVTGHNTVIEIDTSPSDVLGCNLSNTFAGRASASFSLDNIGYLTPSQLNTAYGFCFSNVCNMIVCATRLKDSTGAGICALYNKMKTSGWCGSLSDCECMAKYCQQNEVTAFNDLFKKTAGKLQGYNPGVTLVSQTLKGLGTVTINPHDCAN